MGLILVRYAGEIGIKGKNRGFFVKRLRRNLRSALREQAIDGEVWSEEQRVYVQVDDAAADRAAAALQRVFGIASLSIAHRMENNLDDIKSAAVRLAQQAKLCPPQTFRVQVRRPDKSFAYTSPEVGRMVGAAVWEVTHAPVDLSDRANVTIGVEIRTEGTLVYGDILSGAGGMPIGTQGRVFALLSGGIDSPVATWLMMKRGCGVIPIHFAQSEIEKTKALENCRVLERWSAGWAIKPIVLDHQATLDPIANRLYQMGEERWTCLFCKRAMIAQAARLAPQYHVQALVMGDSLGQVASQTLQNMVAISWDAPLPILRPLIAFDKDQIKDLGRKLGTYQVSTSESTSCPFLPSRPLTSANLEQFKDIASRLARDGALHEPD